MSCVHTHQALDGLGALVGAGEEAWGEPGGGGRRAGRGSAAGSAQRTTGGGAATGRILWNSRVAVNFKQEWRSVDGNIKTMSTSLLPPLGSSFFFAGAAFGLCCFSGWRLTFSTWGPTELSVRGVPSTWRLDRLVESGDPLPACCLPSTTPQLTWLESCPPSLGKDLHGTPVGLKAVRQWNAHKDADVKTKDVHHSHTPWICCTRRHAGHSWPRTHLARDLMADWHDAAVCQLKDTHHLAGQDIQRHLGYHSNSACWGVHQAVAYYRENIHRTHRGVKNQVGEL